jgi:hypothetical protein
VAHGNLGLNKQLKVAKADSAYRVGNSHFVPIAGDVRTTDDG